MIYEELKIDRTVGYVLVNDIRTDLGTLSRGHVITQEDVVMLEVIGIKTISVAKIEDGDLELNTTKKIVANQLAGEGTGYIIKEDGIVKIVAAKSGHFVVDCERVRKFNNMSGDIVLNTIMPYIHVNSGDVVAKLEFNSPLYKGEEIKKLVFSLLGNIDLLSIKSVLRKKAAVIYTEFYKDDEEKTHLAANIEKLTNNIQNTQLDFTMSYFAEHNKNSIADQLENALDSSEKFDFIFLISSVKTQGCCDVIPSAIKEIADTVDKPRGYLVGLSDMIVATKRNVKIINIPFNYKDSSLGAIDSVILKSVVDEKTISREFDYLYSCVPIDREYIGVNDLKELCLACKDENSQKTKVAVVILAAGSSMRTMTYNKLLADVDGEPLFIRTVKNAIEANTGPVFVVLGHQSDEFEKYLANLDVNIVTNLSHRDGVKTSVLLGLGNVPNICSGAILLPADMPCISPKHLINMVKKVDRRKKNQLIITSYKKSKYNPVFWSTNLMKNAEIIPENSSMRPVLVEYEDFTDLVEIPKEAELLDVDYPADLEKLRSLYNKK